MLSLSCSEMSTEEANQLIARSPNLTQLDSICKELPKPEDFTFVFKDVSGNAKVSNVGYYYSSSTGWEDVRNHFMRVLTGPEWIFDGPDETVSRERGYLQFHKEKVVSVSIEKNGKPGVTYAISCSH